MNEVANYLEQVKVFQAVSPEEAHTASVLWLNLAHWHKKLA